MPDILRLVGDALSIIVLSVIWSFTLTAWKQVPADAKVPLQVTGATSARVKKPLGLLFAPIVITVFLITPTLTGVAHSATSLQNAVILFALRALLAAGLGLMAISHLRHVLVTLRAEGVIPQLPDT